MTTPINSDIIDVIMKKEINLTIPADIVDILSRARDVYDDFDFSMYITVEGEICFCDLVGYWDDGEYRDRTPEQTWTLVRKWWEQAKHQLQFDEDVIQAKKDLEEAQKRLEALENKADKKGWHFWK